MKIAHISDIHIRLASRHTEYKSVFDNLVEDIRSQEPDLIINTGDSVHNKVHLSPEVFSMLRYLYLELTKIAPNIIIDGNHDMNISNENRMSSIKSFVELFNDSRGVDKIIYYGDAGIYNYDDITFFHYPMVGNDIPDIEAIDKTKINIGLYHGVVGGAKTDGGYKFKKQDQKIKIPHSLLDAVLLGDIHKHQFLKDNMAYASSLLQQGWGESPQGHGYLMWEFDKNTLIGKEFREIKNDWGMYKVDYVGDEIKSQYDYIPPMATVKVLYDGGAIREDMIRAVEEKYNVKNILLEEKVYDSEGKRIDVKEDIVNVHNYETQKDIVSNYFDDDDDKKDILELNETLFEQNKHRFDTNSKRVSWVPEHMEFSNLFVFGEGNKFVFDNKQGVIGLFSPNTSGKSSFLDAVQFSIYGETARTSTYDDIINKQSKDYSTIIFLKTDTQRFSIERSGKRTTNGWSNSLTFKEYDSSGNVVVEEGNMGEAKKLIDKYFGDSKSYQKTSYIYQDSDERFLNLTPAKRKEWLYNNLGLEVFEILHSSAKDESKSIRTTIDYLEDKDIKKEIDQLIMDKSYHDVNLEKTNKILKIHEDKRNEFDDEIGVLNSSKFYIDDNIVDISGDINEVENDIEISGREIRTLKDSLGDDISPSPEITKDLNNLNSQLMELKKRGTDTKLDDEIEKQKQIDGVISKGQAVKIKIETLKSTINNEESKFDFTIDVDDINKKIDDFRKLLGEISEKKYKIKDLEKKVSEGEERSKILSEDDRFENEELCRSCPLLSSAFESKEELENNRIELKTLQDELNNTKDPQDKIKNLESAKTEMEEIKFSIATANNDMKNQIEKRVDLLDYHTQYTKDLKNIIDGKKELIESKIESLEYKVVSKEKEAHVDIQSQIKDIEHKIEKRDSELKINGDKLKSLREEQKNFEDQKLKIKKNEEVDKLIEDKQDKKRREQEEIDVLSDNIIDIKSNIKTIQNKINDLEQEYNRLKKAKEEYRIFDKYIVGTHKNNIPLQVISNMLGVIQDEINGTLANVVDFKLKLFIEDDDVMCNIIDHRGEREASRLSGMERFVSNLAFRISIAQVGNMSVSNLLSIDEGLSALDSTTAQELPRLFNYLKSKFQNIFVVSHHESMRDMVDYNVEIDTSNIKSRIYEC